MIEMLLNFFETVVSTWLGATKLVGCTDVLGSDALSAGLLHCTAVLRGVDLEPVTLPQVTFWFFKKYFKP